jgi:hypothetical protein
MENCFITQKPVLELAGETDVLKAYLLTPSDETVLAAQAYGSCYVKALAASPWADFWGERVRLQFTHTLGLQVLAELEDVTVLRHPRTQIITLLFPSGASMELPANADLRQAPLVGAYRQLAIREEMNLHNLPPSLAAEIQAALQQDGFYPFSALADHLGIGDCFVHPEVLAEGRLLFNRKLKGYWDASSSSSDCSYPLFIPEVAAAFLQQL